MTKLTFVLALAVVTAVSSSSMFAQGRFKLGGESAQAPTPVAAAPTSSAAPAPDAEPAAQAPVFTNDQEKLVKEIADRSAEKAIKKHSENQPHFDGDYIASSVAAEVTAQRSSYLWNLGWIVAFVALFIFVLFRTRTKTTKVQNTAAHAIAMLMVGLTAASLQATTVDHCATDKNEPAFFVNDGSTSKLVCTGKDLAGIKVITFSDPAVTTANVVVTPHLMKFDLTVGKTAKTPSEPDMILDGKTDGHPLGIVDMPKAGEMDFMYRLLKGSGAASSLSSSNDAAFRAWVKAQIEFYCAKGCSGKSAAEVYKLAIGTQKGSTAEAFRILEAARRSATVDAVFNDSRFAKSVTVQAGSSSYDPRPIYAELGKVQTAVREVVAVENDHDKRIENIENLTLSEQNQRVADQKEAFKVKKLAERTAAATLGLRGVDKKQRCGVYESLQELNPNIEGKVPSGCDKVTPKKK